MGRCRHTRVGRAARPHGRSCRETGPETPLPSSPFADCCTQLASGIASPTALSRRCEGPQTSSSRSSGSRSSLTAATGMPVRSMEPERERTPSIGRQNSDATLIAMPTPRHDLRQPAGPCSGSGSMKTQPTSPPGLSMCSARQRGGRKYRRPRTSPIRSESKSRPASVGCPRRERT